MGVMLGPNEDRMPSAVELARLAGLVPGDIDRKHLE
jgi:NADH-quinone oxidoreductase subunit B